jgi:hypothetical protein
MQEADTQIRIDSSSRHRFVAGALVNISSEQNSRFTSAYAHINKTHNSYKAYFSIIFIYVYYFTFLIEFMCILNISSKLIFFI